MACWNNQRFLSSILKSSQFSILSACMILREGGRSTYGGKKTYMAGGKRTWRENNVYCGKVFLFQGVENDDRITVLELILHIYSVVLTFFRQYTQSTAAYCTRTTAAYCKTITYINWTPSLGTSFSGSSDTSHGIAYCI